MLENNSKEIPEILVKTRNGYHINYNIKKVKKYSDSFFKDIEYYVFNYAFVKKLNRNKIIEAIIRSKYSLSEEFSLINNYNLDSEKYKPEYDEYQKFRLFAKQKADEILKYRKYK